MDAVETDLSLLGRFAQTRDPSAFAEIVRRYAGVVYATCHRVVRNQAVAEEVSQETFFRLMKQPESVSQSVGAWLHRAATNLAVDAIRSDSARRRREQDYAEESARQHQIDEGTAREATSWAEISPFVDEALAELPSDERTLLVEHFLRGRPQNELAAEAKTSAATMSRRIRSAVEALQQKLRRRGLAVAPLPLMGFMHDHAMQAAPASLTGELGKMALASHSSGIIGAPAQPNPPIFWTGAGIVAASLIVGWFCTLLAPSPVQQKPAPATRKQAMVLDR